MYFAGFSFSGSFKDNKINYPYTLSLSKKIPLDSILASKLKTVNNPSIELLTSLGNTNNADALAVSLALDLETVNISQLSEKSFKVIIDLYFQILVFDFSEKKIINSYPINLQYITLYDHEPTDREIRSIFEGFYTGSNPDVKTNIFDLAVEKMNQISIKPKYGNRIIVGHVDLTNAAKKILSDLKQPEDNFKTIVAQSFSRYMVDNQNIAMLPYTKGQAIGGKMAARFVNGNVYNLTIPEADYLFNIQIKDFKTLSDTSQSATTTTQGFFVYTNIEMKQPDLNKVYLDDKFRGSETVVLINGQKPNLKLSYMETLMELFKGFSLNISDKDNDWYEKAISPDQYDIIEEKFEKLNKILQKCK